MRKLTSIAAAILLGVSTLTGADAAPRHRSTQLVEPIGRAIADFDTLLIRTRWDSAGYVVQADFWKLDRRAGTATVTDSAAGVYLIHYVTGSMEGLVDSAGIVIPITATSRFNPQSSFTYGGLKVCRNWTTPVPELSSLWIRDNETRFFPGDSLIVTTIWRVEGVRGFRVSADYSALAPGFTERDLSVRSRGADGAGADTFDVGYLIPGKDQAIGSANDVPLTIIGRDSLCFETRSTELTIDFRTGGPPAPGLQRVVSPVDRGVREGDLLEIESRWDSAGYFVRADLSNLDGGSGGLGAVTDVGEGVYAIRYQVGTLAGLPDSAVTVPITAVSPIGDSFTDRSLRVCRNFSTPAPYHVSSQIRDGRTRFHLGDSLIVLTVWHSPAGIDFEVEPDYRTIVPGFTPSAAVVSEIGADSFEVTYQLPLVKDQFVPDGVDLPLVMLGRDILCSTVRDSTLRIEIDNTGPAASPDLDPLPKDWNHPTLTVSGTAAGATLAVILQNRLHRFPAPVDPVSTRFSVDVSLEAGANEISAWSEDELGNKSFSGSTQIVTVVTGHSLTYPTPFRPMKEFVARDEGGLREVTIEIYNLEGDQIAVFRQDGSSYEMRFVWDGRDRDGTLAQPGYYLVRSRRVPADGKTIEEVSPLLFQNNE
jgi:hypothetical protein